MATASNAVYAHIVKEAGYCGGKAAIDATRVRVMNVVFLWKEGKTVGEIRECYPELSEGQVHAALSYYYDHVEEIDAELSADEGSASAFEAEKAEAIRKRTAR
ncbi:MAG: DUF433 domain-containing protein [Vicinamibacteria bacterium]